MTDRSTVCILTKRFRLRPLTPADATARYQAWLRDRRAQRYIQFAAKAKSIADLRAYIDARAHRKDSLFLGIFVRASGEHIGNIKYEPIDHAHRSAEMGILIGEPAWRGRGVGPEVIRASAQWLRENEGITRVFLGVERLNKGALSAYRRTGFRTFRQIAPPRPPKGVLRMVLSVNRV